jgi:hypothetical protein
LACVELGDGSGCSDGDIYIILGNEKITKDELLKIP